MKKFLPLLIVVTIVSCKGQSNKPDTSRVQNNYAWVKSWPDSEMNLNPGQPTGIGVDTNDHIFVFHRAGRRWTEPFPDSMISQNTILELDNESGKIIRSWGANYFIMPHGLTVDKDNNVWVTDVGLHQVLKFSHDGTLLMKLGEAKVPGKDSAHFNLPTDIAVAEDGFIYVSDGYGNSRVVKFSSTGNYIKEWGTYGNKPGEFIIPHGIAIDHKNTLYVADRQNNRVQLFDTSGKFIRELKNNVQVEQLPSVAIDKSGHLFAIDYDPTVKADSMVSGSTFFTFDSSQHAKNHFGATGSAERTPCWFHDLAIDSRGAIYVGDILGLKLLKFKPESP